MTDPDILQVEADPVRPPRRRPGRAGQWLLWILGPAVVLAGIGWYVFTVGRYASTDNAYLRADVITIAAEVPGRVAEVAVRENQHVRAGEVLFRLDPQPYELAVNELHAQAVALAEYWSLHATIMTLRLPILNPSVRI